MGFVSAACSPRIELLPPEMSLTLRADNVFVLTLTISTVPRKNFRVYLKLFSENFRRKVPELYATFKLMNVKSHEIYSSKFVLSVANQNQMELATEEDHKYGIDHRARLFKADTWEAIKKMAQENEYVSDAAKPPLQSNQALKIRSYCEVVEKARRVRRGPERLIAEKDEVIAEKDAALQAQAAEIAHLKALLATKQ